MTKIYAIDFGLSKEFLHSSSGEHIAMIKHKGIVGTARFASINAHMGAEEMTCNPLGISWYI
jgi:hypothetical protein